MTDTKREPRVPIDQWQVSLLRYSVFLSAKSHPDTTNWWNAVVGEPPESVMAEPRSGIRRDVGTLDFGALQLTTQPFRLDWHVVPLEVAQPTPVLGKLHVPSLGKLPEVIGKFFSIVDKAASIEKLEIYRVAFGAVCELQRDSHEHAYNTLNSYLPVVVDVDSSDFLYQINRRRNSQAIEGITINKLSKWNVMKASNLFLNPTLPPTIDDGGLYTCRTELDINNVPMPDKLLPIDKIPSLLREFYELGVEILRDGDTR